MADLLKQGSCTTRRGSWEECAFLPSEEDDAGRTTDGDIIERVTPQAAHVVAFGTFGRLPGLPLTPFSPMCHYSVVGLAPVRGF